MPDSTITIALTPSQHARGSAAKNAAKEKPGDVIAVCPMNVKPGPYTTRNCAEIHVLGMDPERASALLLGNLSIQSLIVGVDGKTTPLLIRPNLWRVQLLELSPGDLAALDTTKQLTITAQEFIDCCGKMNAVDYMDSKYDTFDERLTVEKIDNADLGRVA